jgi:hypothetical protein
MLLTGLALLIVSGEPPAAQGPRTTRPVRICRVEERLGTILPHRTCRTADEWATYDRAAGRIHEQDMMHIENHFTTQALDRKPTP